MLNIIVIVILLVNVGVYIVILYKYSHVGRSINKLFVTDIVRIFLGETGN